MSNALKEYAREMLAERTAFDQLCRLALKDMADEANGVPQEFDSGHKYLDGPKRGQPRPIRLNGVANKPTWRTFIARQNSGKQRTLLVSDVGPLSRDFLHFLRFDYEYYYRDLSDDKVEILSQFVLRATLKQLMYEKIPGAVAQGKEFYDSEVGNRVKELISIKAVFGKKCAFAWNDYNKAKRIGMDEMAIARIREGTIQNAKTVAEYRVNELRNRAYRAQIPTGEETALLFIAPPA